MSACVGIVALGAANRRSIEAALLRAGAATRFISDRVALRGCDALVIPGVANFGYVATELERTGLRSAILETCVQGLPLLGICVGYQLLFERSDEAPHMRGLGLLRGSVRRLRTPRVPHIGWNRVNPVAAESAVQRGWAYFANAYAPDADVADAIATTSDGADAFASAARAGKVSGVQFHPERSGAYGAALLEDFVRSATVKHAR